MKIRGRFIGILAVLGLLIALLPLAPVGAVAGVVTLSGGEKGQFFSDRPGENVITIQVNDADLSPTRKGTARSTAGTTGSVSLVSYFVGGEKDRTEMFDGGQDNPYCDQDGDGDDTEDKQRATEQIRTDVAAEDTDAGRAAVKECASQGNATVTDSTSGDGDTDSDDTFAFTLEGIARDRHVETSSGDQSQVGVVNAKDIISVVVNGITAVAAVDGNNDDDITGDEVPSGAGPYFSVNSLNAAASGADATPGGGIRTVMVHRIVPQNADESVIITYRETEFDFTAPGDTPLTLAGTQVKYDPDEVDARSFFGATSEVGISSATGTIIGVGGSITGHVVATFAYNVKDTEKEVVTLTSGSAGDRKLDGSETSASSSVFESKVAIFHPDDYLKIQTQVNNHVNDAGSTAAKFEVKIGWLNYTNGLTDAGVTGSDTLAVRVITAATALGFENHATDKASDLLKQLIPGRDGDTINVTYADANPAVTVPRSAKVDMAAPVVTLVSPTDKLYTSDRTATLSAEVTDTGAGVNQSEITVWTSTGVALGATVAAPIVDGYKVTNIPSGEISEGTKAWGLRVVDKVGNTPRSDNEATKDTNEAPKGAAAYPGGEVGNPFKFTVDTRAPTVSTGKTGLSLKDPGVTSGDNMETEKPNDGQWVRVNFSLGTGGAPLDPATVSASDFRVDDAVPLDAKINSVSHGDVKKGSAVYLQVGALDTDARPEVELTGEIRDRAGNIRSEGRVTSLSDGLAPKVTVTTSADIARDEITVTVSSSERLRSNPIIDITETKPVKRVLKDGVAALDQAIPGASPMTVSLQAGGLTTWTATHKNPDGTAKKFYVVVDVSDQADNRDVEGDATNEDDLINFQVDSEDPRVKFKDAAGKDLGKTKQEEGAVWIVAEFDEDEHADDKFRSVTVTSLILMDKDNGEAVTEDASIVFGGEVDCVDHEVTAKVTLAGTEEGYAKADATQKDKCAERTIAVDLTPGMYNIKVTGVDQTGNERTANTDFEVTAAKPFELTLRPGQNFISIPGMPMDDGGNIDTLFSDEAISAVSTYDRSRELAGENPWLRSSKDLETGMFSGDITAIEPGKAYFVNSTASVIVKVKLQAAGQLPPTIPVRQGFNAIGFWSVSGADDAEIDLYLGSIGWSVAYSYDPTPGKGWEVIRKDETDAAGDPLDIEAGKGYLVYALYDSVLTP